MILKTVIKVKTCPVCDNDFMPSFNTTQKVCSVPCSIIYGRTKAAEKKVKADNKAHNVRKRKLKDNDKSIQKKLAQANFNKHIRIRDKRLPCISCNRYHDGQYHAGHYQSVGASSELRFNEDNCHKQCAPCNNHLSGNLINYRVNLITKIGLERVKFLEGPQVIKQYTARDFKVIAKWYKRKVRRLENA